MTEWHKTMITETIRALREALGISQEHLARRLNVSLRTVARYEKDHTPNPLILSKLRLLAVQANRPDLAAILEERRIALSEGYTYDTNSGVTSSSALALMVAVNRTLIDDKYVEVRRKLLRALKPVLDELALGVPMDDLEVKRSEVNR